MRSFTFKAANGGAMHGIDWAGPGLEVMGRHFNVLVYFNYAYAFDRRAFEGIAAMTNERGDVRLSRMISEAPWKEIVRTRQVDGIIVPRLSEADHRELNALGIPFVTLADSSFELANEYVVAMDEAAIGRMAARYYIDAGYERFAVFVRPSRLGTFGDRIGSFIEEVKAAGHVCEIGLSAHNLHGTNGPVEDENLWDADADQWFRTLPKPTAMFCPYDYYAHIAVNVGRSIGLRVPDDLAVIGVDDDEVYCMTTSPQLSSVVTPARQIGQRALSVLIDVIQGKTDVPRRTLFKPPDIVVRGSSSDFALQDADVIAAVRFIRENVSRGVSVSQVAEHVLLSRRTLERRFLLTLSHTVRDEIRRAKISQAKRLLIDTDLPYSEVARRSGLVQQQQLNRLIKLSTGHTPVQFRKHARAYRSA